ncbi:hypothetical protein ACFL6C_13135 [Myxococcota bacterium]
MAELPPVPNLDPDSPKDDAPAVSPPEGGAGTAKGPAPAKVPTQRSMPPISDQSSAPEESSAPKVVPTPIGPPSETSEDGDDNSENAVQDSVEEVLQQTSAQTLQLSHLEDILNALNQTLGDLQDEMHAGFAEIRAVTEATAEGQPRQAGRESLTVRFDFVEEQAIQANKRQSLLTMIAIGQAVLLVIVLIVILATSGNKSTTTLPASVAPKSDPEITEIKNRRPTKHASRRNEGGGAEPPAIAECPTGSRHCTPTPWYATGTTAWESLLSQVLRADWGPSSHCSCRKIRRSMRSGWLPAAASASSTSHNA